MEELLTTALQSIMETGITGVFVVLLIIAVIAIVRRMWVKDTEHSKRIDSFTDVMQKHAVNESQQTEIMKDLKTLLTHELSRNR